MTNDEIEVRKCFILLLQSLKEAKPDDRSEEDRRYAIVITELEKAEAYYEYFVLRDK